MRKRMFAIGGIALIIAGIAAIVFRDPDPQALLRKAAKKLIADKTFHLEMNASMVGLPAGFESGAMGDATGVDIVFKGDFDRSDVTSPAWTAMFETVQGGAVVLSGEARRRGDARYLKLKAAKGLEGIDEKRVTNVWMKTRRPLLDLFAPADTIPVHLDAADWSTLLAAVPSIDLFEVAKVLPKEKTDGRMSYHYAVEVDMDAVSGLLLKQRELLKAAPVDAEDVQAVAREIEQWGVAVGEVWVGKRDHRLKKLTLGTVLGADGGGAAAVTITILNEGKTVRVDEPEAQDIEKILGPLFNKRLGLAGSRGLAETAAPQPSKAVLPSSETPSDQELDTDGDGLKDGQEGFYGTDAWNPDTDGDGYGDGQEIDNGMNPLGPGALFGFGL